MEFKMVEELENLDLYVSSFVFKCYETDRYLLKPF